MSQGRPAKCTGTMARVRGVIFASMRVGVDVHACAGSTSTSTGVAPAWMMAFTVAQKVMRAW